MPTDWPGHGQFNRQVHLFADCRCGLIYTPAMEPPWLYDWAWIKTGSGTYWDFLENPQWLIPSGLPGQCRWTIQIVLPPPVSQARIITIDMGRTLNPPTIATARFTVTRTDGTDSNTYANSLLLTTLGLFPLPRGTELVFPDTNWTLVNTSGPPQGPPPYTLTTIPHDCLPGWIWGEQIPAHP